MIYIAGEDESVFPYGVIRTGSNTGNITIPSLDPANPSKLVQAGDLAVCWDMPLNTASIPTFAVPSGFTAIISLNTGTARGVVSYKILTAADIGQTRAAMNGNLRDRKILMTFRMSRPVQSVTVWNNVTDGELTAGNPALFTILSAGTPADNVMVIGFAASEGTISDANFAATSMNGSAFNDLGETAAEDGQGDGIGGSVTRGAYQYYRFGTSTGNATVDIPDLGDINGVTGVWLSLT